MVWVVYKSRGDEYVRAADGQPMWARTKREAVAMAKAAGLVGYYIEKVVH